MLFLAADCHLSAVAGLVVIMADQIDAEKKILEWCGHLAVPKWVDEKAYNNCKACSKTLETFIKKDKHHCRLCGQMFVSSH